MSFPKPSPNPDKDERLSQLIGLKRLERPDPSFWKEFEQEFRSKQLASLVGVAPWHERYAKKAIRFARKATLPSAAIATVFAIALLGINHFSQLAQTTEPGSSTLAGVASETPTDALFVVDQTNTPSVSAGQLSPVARANPPATYQVSVMAKSNSDPSYQLRSSPVTLSPADTLDPSQPADSGFGATVITTGQNF